MSRFRISYPASRREQSRYTPTRQRAETHLVSKWNTFFAMEKLVEFMFTLRISGKDNKSCARGETRAWDTFLISYASPTRIHAYKARSISFGENYHFRKRFIALHVRVGSCVRLYAYKARKYGTSPITKFTSNGEFCNAFPTLEL